MKGCVCCGGYDRVRIVEKTRLCYVCRRMPGVVIALTYEIKIWTKFGEQRLVRYNPQTTLMILREKRLEWKRTSRSSSA